MSIGHRNESQKAPVVYGCMMACGHWTGHPRSEGPGGIWLHDDMWALDRATPLHDEMWALDRATPFRRPRWVESTRSGNQYFLFFRNVISKPIVSSCILRHMQKQYGIGYMTNQITLSHSLFYPLLCSTASQCIRRLHKTSQIEQLRQAEHMLCLLPAPAC